MKHLGTLTLALVAATTFAVTDFADAARIGGGRSLGTQRSISPQRQASPPATQNPNAASQPVMPTPAPGANMPAKVGAPPAPSGISRWLGPIAGIAAGLGLAALLSHFGLPEGMGTFLVLALLAIGAVFLVRMFMARRMPARAGPTGPMQYAGYTPPAASPGPAADPFPAWGGAAKSEPPRADVEMPKPFPPGFDVPAFVSQAKLQFNRLQAAYDAGDRGTLADVMTPEMYDEVGRDLSVRKEHHATEVVTLDAEVLEVTTEADSHWASVRYTGLLREDGEALPKPIDEVWNLTKPVNGKSGWLLAGIQQVS